MVVSRIDVSDDAQFAAFHDVYARAFDRDFDQPYGPVEKRAGLRDDDYNAGIVLLARDVDGAAVGGAYAQLPLQDNRDFAYVEVFVVPQRRREGHGRALLEALVAEVRAVGRSTLMGEAAWAVDDQGAPARAFAEASGFALDLLEAHRELGLPAEVGTPVVDPAYEIRGWRDVCPDAWVDGYAQLRRVMVQEAPSGDAGLENEKWDAARVRHEEARWVEQGRSAQISVALAMSGEVVGHTQLLFPEDAPAEVFQWDTLVLPAHRGHGLGLALKQANMRDAADLLEGRRRIHTYNAASNAPMIAVNEAMGFRQIAWVGEYVRTV
jgi:GNAT superfamily N-acetyltransferase